MVLRARFFMRCVVLVLYFVCSSNSCKQCRCVFRNQVRRTVGTEHRVPGTLPEDTGLLWKDPERAWSRV
eukprot:12846511-Alexandrium_andersonii.AAC.1